MDPMVTIDDLLEEWTLTPGAKGNPESHKACAVSLLSVLAGEPFSDRLECAHPWLNDLMIRAFDDDDTTPEQRVALVWAGVDGLVETRWIASEIVLHAFSRRPDADLTKPEERPLVELALDVFAAIAAWKADPKHLSLDGARLVGARLDGARGDRWTVLPEGWKVDDSGLIVAEVAD